jgi:hypothetical protein
MDTYLWGSINSCLSIEFSYDFRHLDSLRFSWFHQFKADKANVTLHARPHIAQYVNPEQNTLISIGIVIVFCVCVCVCVCVWYMTHLDLGLMCKFIAFPLKSLRKQEHGAGNKFISFQIVV